MVHINGEDVDASGKVLKEYLEENGYIIEGIAVECNEVIVPKDKYGETIISDGDTIEIVSFVGGKTTWETAYRRYGILEELSATKQRQ